LASLVLIAPLLVLYEAGVLWLGAQKNGADVFMRSVLELLGFSQHFLLPILTVCLLLAWHYLIREPWRLSKSVIPAMAVESLLLGVVLRFLLMLQLAVLPMNLGQRICNVFQTSIAYLGAGIYEELLFRLILLSFVAWIFRFSGAKPWASMATAVVVTSLLFAFAHHVGPYGEFFVASRFLFRFLASVFFSVLFIYRGFGIAAASHAAYDILTGLFG
jgi:membrane protease YdiL (CAAX protease family)